LEFAFNDVVRGVGCVRPGQSHLFDRGTGGAGEAGFTNNATIIPNFRGVQRVLGEPTDGVAYLSDRFYVVGPEPLDREYLEHSSAKDTDYDSQDRDRDKQLDECETSG